MKRSRVFGSSLACLMLASPAVRPAVGDNTVGMNIHIGPQSFIDAAADLGVGWVRMDANWFALEPSRDGYDWGWLDASVDRATAAGLRVFLTLGYTPAWVARHGDSDGDPGNDCPDNAADWVDFVTDAVLHYRARGVTHFGLWNEPNLRQFFEGTVDEYVNIIALPGAAAVRSACSDCKALGPELANVGECDDYLERVLQLAGASAFDIITHHSYNGFAETGWQIWDGDGFINVLDDQRFPFTRRDLRQLLDAAGYQGEVWITETGYRATPIGDAGEENLQATYVRRVLEEQLKRAWYTASFFYEICDCGVDQPGCTIDGFGLMRPTAGAFDTRRFPQDFRLKPAFLLLRQFIDDHPEIAGREPPPQCGDGQDNDRDGLTDLADRGCTSATDDNEADDPPRQRLDAYCAAIRPALDGDLGEFGPDGWIELPASAWHGVEPPGEGDLAVRVAARWTAEGLFFGFEVEDDVHDNAHPPADLWQGDSVQMAFDIGRNGGLAYDDTDDHEINFALANDQPAVFRYHGPSGASDDFGLAVLRRQHRSSYEIRIGSTALPGWVLAAGSTVHVSFLVNDADGAGRVGWMEWTRGIGMSKAPAYYGELVLSAACSGGPALDGGVDGGADAGADAGSDAGFDAGFDAGPDAGSDAGEDAGADGNADGGGDGGGDLGGGDSGCGCGPAGTGAGWIGLAVLLAARRRKPLSRRNASG